MPPVGGTDRSKKRTKGRTACGQHRDNSQKWLAGM